MSDYMTAQEIADYLRISRRTVYNLMDLKPDYGGIRNFSIGGSRRVKRSDLERWIDNQYKEAR
jgi:excisionase family DNA binding protein